MKAYDESDLEQLRALSDSLPDADWLDVERRAAAAHSRQRSFHLSPRLRSVASLVLVVVGFGAVGLAIAALVTGHGRRQQQPASISMKTTVTNSAATTSGGAPATVHRIVRDGFIVPVPKGWDVRVRALPLIKGTALTAATFRLPREPPLDGGLHQITTMRARDLYVTIVGSPATGDLSRGLKRVVNHQVPPVRLSEFKTNFEGASPARPRAWYSFIVGGTNYFCSITVVGPHPSSGQVARVNEFLRGIRIR